MTGRLAWRAMAGNGASCSWISSSSVSLAVPRPAARRGGDGGSWLHRRPWRAGGGRRVIAAGSRARAERRPREEGRGPLDPSAAGVPVIIAVEWITGQEVMGAPAGQRGILDQVGSESHAGGRRQPARRPQDRREHQRSRCGVDRRRRPGHGSVRNPRRTGNQTRPRASEHASWTSAPSTGRRRERVGAENGLAPRTGRRRSSPHVRRDLRPESATWLLSDGRGPSRAEWAGEGDRTPGGVRNLRRPTS